MRLLNVQSHEVVDFSPAHTPPYVILSHRWGAEEVLFGDMQSPKSRQAARTKASWPKIEHTCRRAREDGFEYVWIDSCCIDKSSSAELSEAINSMFAWYKDARICYAYLEGVPANVDTSALESAFRSSRELLAPANVIFFSDDWTEINSKASLCLSLADITGIDENVLAGRRPIRSVSVATRMSWAARRETTRPEDMAYSLFGIFNVNMPMLYGEGGQKAFVRLQEQIMGTNNDHSLFAWVDKAPPLLYGAGLQEALQSQERPRKLFGLLAPSPSYFENSRTVARYFDWEMDKPYSMTSLGLRIQLHLIPLLGGLHIAVLNCRPPDHGDFHRDHLFLGLCLREVSPGQFVREGAGFTKVHEREVQERGKLQDIYVQQAPIDALDPEVAQNHVFKLRALRNTQGSEDDIYEYWLDKPGPRPKGWLRVREPGPAYILEFAWNAARNGAQPDEAFPENSMSSNGWAPSWFPVSFAVPVHGVAAALLFRRRPDYERILVLLGSDGNSTVTHRSFELPPPSGPGFDLDCWSTGSLTWSQGEDARRTLLSGQELTKEAARDLFLQRQEPPKYHDVKVTSTTYWAEDVKFSLVELGLEVLRLSDRFDRRQRPVLTRSNSAPTPTKVLNGEVPSQTQRVDKPPVRARPAPLKMTFWPKSKLMRMR